jgi:bacterioferritin (cytochrome b1)
MLARFLGLGDARRDLVTDLATSYRAEVEQAALLRHQAEHVRYPQMAEELRRLAALEDRHAAELLERIRALGGTEPFVERPLIEGKNAWERFVAARLAAQRKRQRMVEQVGHWDPEEPEAVAVLGRIEREDGETLAVYDGLIMRSDPQALD